MPHQTALLHGTLLTLKQILSKYGQPGDQNNLKAIDLPYPMIISWDRNKSVTKLVCHKLVADNFKKAFNDIRDAYGLEEIRRLGINIYGGCFNHRPKRGAEKKYTDAIAKGNMELACSCLSTHSWAIAIDLDPDRNKLKETARTARFARSEYEKMVDIFYANNLLGYGPEKDFDWMHWEISE